MSDQLNYNLHLCNCTNYAVDIFFSVFQIYFNRSDPKSSITISNRETSHDQESPPLQTQESNLVQVPVRDDSIHMNPVYQLDNNPAYDINETESEYQTSTTEYDYINTSEYI